MSGNPGQTEAEVQKQMKNLLDKTNVKMIGGNDKQRAERCLQNINQVLEMYDCELHPIVTVTPMGNNFGYNIVPKKRQSPILAA